MKRLIKSGVAAVSTLWFVFALIAGAAIQAENIKDVDFKIWLVSGILVGVVLLATAAVLREDKEDVESN